MKTQNTIFGLADRGTYEFAGTTIHIDKLHAPRLPNRPYLWHIRESRRNAKKRSDETGAVVFPHTHTSLLKIYKCYESWGETLVEAINYLNMKRKGGPPVMPRTRYAVVNNLPKPTIIDHTKGGDTVDAEQGKTPTLA